MAVPPSDEQIRTLVERCQQFRDSKAQDGYPDSLALCIIDSVQSTGVTYASVTNVVNRYRKYRRDQGGDPSTDTAHDLAATFEELKGHKAWAVKIGNDNKKSTDAGGTLKDFAIEAEASVMIDQRIITAQDLRDAAEHPDRIAEVKSAWLKVPGQRTGRDLALRPNACRDSGY